MNKRLMRRVLHITNEGLMKGINEEIMEGKNRNYVNNHMFTSCKIIHFSVHLFINLILH